MHLYIIVLSENNEHTSILVGDFNTVIDHKQTRQSQWKK